MLSETESDLLATCADEPIHRPGEIQPHGIFVAFRSGDLAIVHISENVENLFGKKADDLLGEPLTGLLHDLSEESLRQAILSVTGTFANPFHFKIAAEDEIVELDGIAHRLEKDVFVLELEPTGNRAETASEAKELTARAVDHYFSLTQRAIGDLEACHSFPECAQSICDNLKEFTGFDRVMFYHFSPDYSGEVIAEAAEDHLESFEGLHFPASDIPAQARALYEKNWLRLIVDVEADPCPIRSSSQPADTIDLSDSVLRAVSPVHIQYLKNMGVRASMSISLLSAGKLSGLIACHHYSGPYALPYHTRAACMHFGLVISSHLDNRRKLLHNREIHSKRSRLKNLMHGLASRDNPANGLIENGNDFCEIFDACGFVLFQAGYEQSFGRVAGESLLSSLKARLAEQKGDRVFQSDNLSRDLMVEDPDVAGVMAIDLGGPYLLSFFRPEAATRVRWAGNPERPFEHDGKHLSPRSSFQEWIEERVNHCEAWTEVDQFLALEVQSAFSPVLTQRALQLEQINMALKRRNEEIQRFTYHLSHDLKSPLATINGCACLISGELPADQSTSLMKESMAKISGSTARMSSLIDAVLSYSRLGTTESSPEIIDLEELIRQVVDDFSAPLSDAKVKVEFVNQPGAIMGYPGQVCRVFENLIGNVLKYATTGDSPLIRISGSTGDSTVTVIFEDNGPGIPEKFRPRAFEMFQRFTDTASGTGIGLASVAKIVETHQGSIRLTESDLGGARFDITFPTISQSTLS